MTLILSGTNGLSDVDGSAATPAIRGTDTNTGMFFPAADTIGFAEGGAEVARFDSSGNFGLGVTPSAVSSSDRVLQVRNFLFDDNTNGYGILRYNNYYNGTNDIYLNTGAVSAFQMAGNAFKWYQAASGTAGNAISFTQAMTLDASGNLGVGTTSPIRRLDVVSSNTDVFQVIRSTSSSPTNVALRIQDATTGTGISDGLYLGRASSINYLWAYENEPLVFGTNSLERARITSGGDFYYNTTSGTEVRGLGSDAYGFRVLKDSYWEYAGSNSAYMIVNNTTTTGTRTLIAFRTTGTDRGSITSDGSTVAYNTSSDYRLKDNPQPLTGSGAFIDALKPKTWTWKETGAAGVGFIAHEVQEVSPGSVTGTKDAVDEEGKPIMQAMEYGSAEFIANIIAELQALRQRVAALESGAK